MFGGGEVGGGGVGGGGGEGRGGCVFFGGVGGREQIRGAA